jgi:hypothetical protein
MANPHPHPRGPGEIHVRDRVPHTLLQESFANFMTVQYYHDTRGHDWVCLRRDGL